MTYPDPNVLTTAATAPAYVKHREDGWPLCPGCGADELWSNVTPATVETIVACLACDWRPGYPEDSQRG